MSDEKQEPIDAVNIPETDEAPKVEQPTRRGRGRPRKASEEIPGAAATKSEPAKKPGRPKGTTKKAEPDAGALAKQIQGLHVFASMATGIKELAITESEAAMLSNGLLAVASEYGLSVSGKTGAALQLLAAAAMVYIPRVGAIQSRAAESKARKESQAAANVGATFETPIDPNPPKARSEPKTKAEQPKPDEGAQAAALHGMMTAINSGLQ